MKGLKSKAIAAAAAVALAMGLCPAAALAAPNVETGSADGQVVAAAVSAQSELDGSTDLGDGYFFLFGGGDSHAYLIAPGGTVDPDITMYYYSLDEPADEWGRTALSPSKYTLVIEKENDDESSDNWLEYDTVVTGKIGAGSYRVTATAKQGSGLTGSTYSYFDVVEGQWRLSDAEVEFIPDSFTYTGKAVVPLLDLECDYEGEYGTEPYTLKEGRDYTYAISNNVNAGSAKVAITGKGAFSGSLVKTFTIAKAENYMRASAKSPSVKASKVKKKNQTVAKSKAFTVSGTRGKVTFAKTSGNKKITVSSAGKVTVKKGLKKGTYTVGVRVKDAGTANYAAKSVNVKLKVKVK